MKYKYNKKGFYLFCMQRNQPYGGWKSDEEDESSYTLNEIKETLIDYHLIDQPASIKYYSLRNLLEIYEWGIFLDKDGEKEIDYSMLR